MRHLPADSSLKYSNNKYTTLVAPACEETTFQLVKLLIMWPVKSATAVVAESRKKKRPVYRGGSINKKGRLDIGVGASPGSRNHCIYRRVSLSRNLSNTLSVVCMGA